MPDDSIIDGITDKGSASRSNKKPFDKACAVAFEPAT
jgi:hypothetical protein